MHIQPFHYLDRPNHYLPSNWRTKCRFSSQHSFELKRAQNRVGPLPFFYLVFKT